ncbi:MAG: triose-phosphate isomerase [Rhodospirillales bacterium]|nr:triose-phosphate isomerase [Rhodospirillales bacterium]
MEAELTRRKLIAGNWKMNGLKEDGLRLAREVAHRAVAASRAAGAGLHCDVLVCPPATLLFPLAEELTGSPVLLGAQDCHAKPKGAHTGDISALMLRDAGCRFVIVGHSERRADHGETDAMVRAKAEAARAAGLVPIICVGETEAERDAGKTLEVVGRQIAGSVPDGLAPESLVIAYEPVWAIGTGRTPTPDDVADVHAYIRKRLAERVAAAEGVRILYGGSMKPGNAKELLAVENVDGGLIGGASLVATDFWAIVEAAQ